MSAVTEKEAQAQADAFLVAAETSPVRQARYDLRRRGREWAKAASALDDLEQHGDEGVIELAGSLSTGMELFYEHELGHWTPLVRVLQSGGQFSLHLEDPTGRTAGIYRNVSGPASPVVVRP